MLLGRFDVNRESIAARSVADFKMILPRQEGPEPIFRDIRRLIHNISGFNSWTRHIVSQDVV